MLFGNSERIIFAMPENQNGHFENGKHQNDHAKFD